MKPGERIKKIYKNLGMSQRKFSISVGLYPTSLARVVTGETKVSRLLANSIELIYGYSADWIITGGSREETKIYAQKVLNYRPIDWNEFVGKKMTIKKMSSEDGTVFLGVCDGQMIVLQQDIIPEPYIGIDPAAPGGDKTAYSEVTTNKGKIESIKPLTDEQKKKLPRGNCYYGQDLD
jgi:transcriptional regulator with XRE-family HTH domain